MDIVRIEILNPKAKKLLKSLVDLNLIAFREPSLEGFSELLQKLRAEDPNKPNLEEITKEVEAVRNKRYRKKKR